MNLFTLRHALLIFFLAVTLFIWANDGGFYVNGNQLVPMTETDISVKKEILTINRSSTNPDQVDVTVYYEFYNPGQAKTMTVGFEADSPSGDAETAPHNGEQPYIHNFTVDVNSKDLPYQVAIVADSLYYQNGIFKTLTEQQMQTELEESGECCPSFRYVYHFDVTFDPGINIIKHTYTCDLSTFVFSNYEFGYLLTPATRWANKQIDDFTLIIDMGENQVLNILPTFFDDNTEWLISGMGRSDMKANNWGLRDTEVELFAEFFVRKGSLVFKKKNFKPEGELSLISPRGIIWLGLFDSQVNITLPSFTDLYAEDDITVSDPISKKILRNLPFAWRGYIFTTPELKEYFENQIWYLPDSNYKANIESLSLEEQAWVRKWSE